MGFEDKVVVVTGAAGGIGRAVVDRFVAGGARVVATDVEAPEIDGVLGLAADVTSADDWESVVTAALDLGGLDVLVNNAGIEGSVAPIVEQSVEQFDAVMAVNVRGVFLGIRTCAPEMARRGGGAIVNVASVAGLRGSPGIAPYCASKHAVIGLTRSAAKELAGQGIRVNAVCPSPIETRMMRSLESGMSPGNEDSVKAMVESSIPLGRYGEPAEVASAIAVLADDGAEFLTGVSLPVDGGMTA